MLICFNEIILITRIAIVDDKILNRTVLKEKLSVFSELEVTLEADQGEDFLRQLKERPVTERPHVVLMDLEMPGMNGIQTIAIATPGYPEVRFIVLTVFEDNDKIFEAIKAGAHGYLLKEENGARIAEAIAQVLEFDGMPMSPVIARKAIEMLKNGTHQKRDEPMTSTLLSDRELDILKELATGKSYKAIGDSLFISPLTVRKHVSNIYTKLHVDSRVQMLNVAKKNNWV